MNHLTAGVIKTHEKFPFLWPDGELAKPDNGEFTKPNNGGTAKPYVSWHKRDNKWQARIRVNGKPRHLGNFDTEEEALALRAQPKQIHYETDMKNHKMKTSPIQVQTYSPLMGKRQAASYLGVTERYIEKVTRQGLLKAYHPTFKIVRFSMDNLMAFLESGSSVA
jgi:excisionase family DNA binding protein